MSRPFMPFYDGDWMRDTAHLDDHQERAYFRLIMFYWANEGLPRDEKQIARICRADDARRWRNLRPILATFFQISCDGKWTHKRIEIELEKSRKFIEKQRANGAKPKARKEPDRSQNETRARVPQPQPQDLGEPKSISRSALANEFGEFYTAYPKHVGRSDAERAFERVVRRGVSARHVIIAALRFAEAHAKAGTEKQYIPAPAVWLNKGRYDDEDLPQAAMAGPARNRPEKPYNPTYGELLDALRNQPHDDETAGYDGGASCSDAADRDFSGGPTVELRAIVGREALGDFGKPLDGAGDFEASVVRQAQRD